MNNFDLSLHVFSLMKKAGVQTLVVCAGARNAPLVLALEGHDFKIFNFFEERSAAFFALGLIKSTKKPVAVLTTSGTAVAELLPAAIEAFYQGLPLLLVTADRPKTYRGTGSPQTIEQVGIFSKYTENVYDLDAATTVFDFNWSQKQPLHLNVAYAEPLMDKRSLNKHEVSLQKNIKTPEKLKTVSSLRQPLIILGDHDKKFQQKIIDYIVKTKAPVFAESLSHLKLHPQLVPYVIRSSEQLLRQIFKLGHCESVIRIGNVPTLRFWRDLEADFQHVPVLSYSDLPFSGLARPSGLVGIENLNFTEEYPAKKLAEITGLDQKLQIEKSILFKKYPLSEQSLTYQLSLAVKADAVYLGNSLPIRHWDQFAQCDSAAINANRGANGIDGQVSSYLGWSEIYSNSYCFIGDLTALYDLAALGFTPQLNDNKRNIVIMNNFGGHIFKRVFKNDDFINAHKTEFSSWAEMWKWNYLKVLQASDLNEMKRLITDKNIIEIQPSAQQTEQFWVDWDQLCQTL